MKALSLSLCLSLFFFLSFSHSFSLSPILLSLEIGLTDSARYTERRDNIYKWQISCVSLDQLIVTLNYPRVEIKRKLPTVLIELVVVGVGR